jgi:hypothetical protein
MADLLADVARLGRWPVRLVAKPLILPMSLPPGRLRLADLLAELPKTPLRRFLPLSA